MFFYILSTIGALVFLAFPIYFIKVYSKKWSIEKKLFWRIGFYFMVVELFFLAVMGNASSIWPGIGEDPLLTALIMGIVSGLFFELGRFVVLDKVFKSMRSFKEGLYFAFAWRGLEILLMGILILVGIASMNVLTTTDVKTLLPSGSTQEIAQMQEMKQQATEMLNGSPLQALSPMVQHAGYVMLDISLTLIMLLALLKGENKYIWYAVALRGLIAFTTVLFTSVSELAGDVALLVLGAFSLFLVEWVRKNFPKQITP